MTEEMSKEEFDEELLKYLDFSLQEIIDTTKEDDDNVWWVKKQKWKYCKRK